MNKSAITKNDLMSRKFFSGRFFAVVLAGLMAAGLSGLGVAPATASSDDGVRIYLPGDITGDGRADLISTDSAGLLWLRAGRGDGSFPASASKIGHGWTGRTVIPAGDLNGDGRPDILSTDEAGLLWFYPGRGEGRLGAAIKVGHGWSGSDRIFPAGDLNGDSRIDLLAIDGQGQLWFYRGRGDGTFGKRVQVGHGWKASDRLYLGGDLVHSPAHDLLAVREGGQLWVYPGRGDGTFHASQWVGGGWSGLQLAVGDINGDGIGDIVSYNQGAIRTHLGKGGGNFRASVDATKTPSNSSKPSKPTPVKPEPEPIVIDNPKQEELILTRTNFSRNALGVNELIRDPQLDIIAQDWAKYLAEENKFIHNPDLKDLIPNVGPNSGENIAQNWYKDNVGEIMFHQWAESPGHWRNMIREEYTHIGIGVYTTEELKVYGVQVFTNYEQQP